MQAVLYSEILDVEDWEIALPIAVGALTLAAALVVGLKTLGRRSVPAAPARASAPPEPDPFLRGSILEKRTALRRSGKHVDVLVSDADHQAAPIPAWVIDRSSGGLALSVSRAYPVGDILSVRPVEASRHVPWVQIEIRHCYQHDGEWRLSCKFVRTPPYAVLVLFG